MISAAIDLATRACLGAKATATRSAQARPVSRLTCDVAAVTRRGQTAEMRDARTPCARHSTLRTGRRRCDLQCGVKALKLQKQ